VSVPWTKNATLIHARNHCKHQQNKKNIKKTFFENVENTAEHEESFCNSWSLKLVQYSVKRISAEICGEFYILHVANSHRRPPETVASRRVGSAVWIGFSTTRDCRRRKIWSLNILRLFERRTGLAARQHDETRATAQAGHRILCNQQVTKACRYNWHSADGSLGWPFPMLECRYIFSNKIHSSNYIKHHSQTVMVWNYQNADCSLKKN